MTDAPIGETLEQRKNRIAALRRLNSVLPKEKRHIIPPLYDPVVGGEQETQNQIDIMITMTRAQYTKHVCDHLGAENDELWRLYLSPRMIQLTHSALVQKHAACARLAAGTSRSTRAALRRRQFMDLLEKRLQQVEDTLPSAVLTSDRRTAIRLFAAIQAHRRALTANAVQPEAWDLKLWQTIDGLAAELHRDNQPGEPDAPTPVP